MCCGAIFGVNTEPRQQRPALPRRHRADSVLLASLSALSPPQAALFSYRAHGGEAAQIEGKAGLCSVGLDSPTDSQPAVWSHDIVERDGRGVRRDPVAIDTDYNVVAVGKPFYFILFYYLLVLSFFPQFSVTICAVLYVHFYTIK